jgi:hypothetical protein
MSAVRDYQANRYPATVSLPWSCARIDALTFLHGSIFRTLCKNVEIDPCDIFKHLGILMPSALCPCEECCRDYVEQAISVLFMPRQERYVFVPGERHHVYWVHKSGGYSLVSGVVPHREAPINRYCTPMQYLIRMGVQFDEIASNTPSKLANNLFALYESETERIIA